MQQTFSATVKEHFLHPRCTGVLEAPDGEGWAGERASSRPMRIQVMLDAHGVVLDARFATYGCAPAIAAGSYLCEWAIGRPASEVHAVTADQLTDWLGGLPAARRFCANLAVDAMQAALSNCHALPRRTILSNAGPEVAL